MHQSTTEMPKDLEAELGCERAAKLACISEHVCRPVRGANAQYQRDYYKCQRRIYEQKIIITNCNLLSYL